MTLWQVRPTTCTCIRTYHNSARHFVPGTWVHSRQRAKSSWRAVAEDGVGTAWDPEGILPAPPTEGHIARRLRERAERAAQQAAQQVSPGILATCNSGRNSPTISVQHCLFLVGLQLAASSSDLQTVALPPELQAEGVAAADASLYDRPGLSTHLQQRFLPVDLDFPGLRVRHLDPPVLTVERFFTPEECSELTALAQESGSSWLCRTAHVKDNLSVYYSSG